YVGEVLPVMLVRSGAPLNRRPNVKANPALLNDTARLARFDYHDSYGFGLAPFGAEFTTRLSDRFSVVVNTTAGAALFSKIVPYGYGTRANFTVSPGAALQWEVFHRTGVAFGYTFHHLSNASIGKANPGMNSQIFFARVARLGPRG
ncbi:MAG: acyloxyacyl hydrolase, partial [Gemmatimonadaceae bacterium]